MSDQETVVKSIPANIEAERAVLGALLIDPDAIIKVASYLRSEDFYRERHAWIYEAIFQLNERREPLDTVTLIDELERRGHRLDRWGDWNELAGHAHGIVIDPDTGMRQGGSDPRSDGAAIGY